jgi:phosphoglycerol transferase
MTAGVGRIGARARDLAAGHRERIETASFYVAAGALPLAIVSILMRLWTLSLSAPFAAAGDALSTQAMIKGLFETGSLYTNASLGAPGVAQFYDYPSADWANLLIVRLFGLFGAGPAAAMNLFYLTGYAAVGVSTAFLMRRLGASRLVAIVVAVLFALLPYHWLRGEGHLFLSMYWVLPLVLLVLVWLDSPSPPFIRVHGKRRLPLQVRAPQTIAALAIMVVTGASGVYYLFFACFFIVVVALRAAIRDRDYRPIIAGALLVLVGACVFAVQMAPSAVYSARHGKNPVAAVRNSAESETYGLRITQLLLPIPNHRIPELAAKQAFYLKISPGANTEAMFASLGILGSLGFLAAIAALLLGWPHDRRGRPEGSPDGEPAQSASLKWLGMLTVAGVLLGTVAGFGAVFAGAVTPQIRTYNRISVFIALFAFVTLGLLADRLLRSCAGSRWRVIAAVAIACVTVLGVLDQTPPDLQAAPRAAQAEYAAAGVFGAEVQAAVPAGSAVFQLPYLAFPESPPLFQMSDYSPFAGYVHTTGLRWSYGAIKGRSDAAWQEATAALPPAAMIARLRDAGFGALWVQFNGYEDGGVAIRADLEKLLGAPAAVRQDGVIAVWLLK